MDSTVIKEVLNSIYSSCYVNWIIRNPLIKNTFDVINNEGFINSVDSLVKSAPGFNKM